MSSAHVMFLNLDIPDDDPLRPAKIYVCNIAPGFRLTQTADTVEWEGDFVWLVVVNEEDGTLPIQQHPRKYAPCMLETMLGCSNIVSRSRHRFQSTADGRWGS